MRVEVIPPIRIRDELAAIGGAYIQKLFALAGSEGRVISLNQEWNSTGRPANHLYNDICNAARDAAVSTLLPSERNLVSFIHQYE